jgi:hypothetical protein
VWNTYENTWYKRLRKITNHITNMYPVRKYARKPYYRKNNRKVYGTRVPRINVRDTGITKITAGFDWGVIAGDTAAIATDSLAIQLNLFQDSTTYANMFDQYRIDWASLFFSPNQDIPNSSAVAQLNASAYLICAIDYDDDSALTSVASALGYSNSRIIGQGKMATVAIKPCCEMLMDAVSGTGTSARRGVWLATSNTAIKHYGFKTLIPQVTGSSPVPPSWRLILKCGISFKNNR